MKLTGSGVILLENYNNQRNELAIILFRNRHTGIYEDAGGGCDVGETSLMTAKRELQEESLNLFQLPSNIISQNYETGKTNHIVYRQYKGYFVLIGSRNGIQSTWYKYNRQRIMKAGNYVPSHYRETDTMNRFYLSDLIESGILEYQDGNLKCPDVSGNPQIVFDRTIGLIRYAIEKDLFVLDTWTDKIVTYLSKFILRQKQNIKTSNNDFLTGTLSYYL